MAASLELRGRASSSRRLGRLPAPVPPSSMGIDPQQRHCVPERGKQIHLVASDNHSAPVGTVVVNE